MKETTRIKTWERTATTEDVLKIEAIGVDDSLRCRRQEESQEDEAKDESEQGEAWKCC
jgi:hypothetical protein